jgi:CRISPR type III-B/RAMP module-associated protein Cmr3
MPAYTLKPRDLIFMRDARPMEASDAGLGANWPRPDQLWHALFSAFLRQWPEHQQWEHRHHVRENESASMSHRFGALKTIGPFPLNSRTGELFLPCPLDLCADDDGSLSPMRLVEGGGTNLPAPLTKAFQSVRLGKNQPPAWICKADYDKYLRGESFNPAKVDLFDIERNIGIAIDPTTHATIKNKLYQAEYLRLRDNVRFAFEAECPIIVGNIQKPIDTMAKFLETKESIVIGGQQGVAHLEKTGDSLKLPGSTAHGNSQLLRWTLLTPAFYPAIHENSQKGILAHSGGWLPNWIHAETGQVMLPREKPVRPPGVNREQWRRSLLGAPKIDARLVAARVGKPLIFSGWDLSTGPKPTGMTVPPGSCYLFDCKDKADLLALNKALTHQTRSTLFGEKGYGVGVCSQIS